MENLNVNPTLADGDLLELSPMKLPNSILKPSQKDNLIMLQTPVHKHLKVSFITPKRTPAQTPLQQITCDRNSNIPGSVLQDSTQRMLNTPTQVMGVPQNLSAELETPKTGMPPLRKGLIPRRPGVSSHDMVIPTKKSAEICDKQEEVHPKSANDNKWESLRKLDENLRWRERVEVITKLDHQEYTDSAKECILQMIDKAVDISQAKTAPPQGPQTPGFTTPVSKIVTPITTRNSDIISPIVPRANPLNITHDGVPITPISTLNGTPISTLNGTFDVSAHGSFIAENTSKGTILQNQKDPSAGENKDNSGFKVPSDILKPVSVHCKKQSTNISTRSTSLSDQVGFGGNSDSKTAFTIGQKSYSFDLGDIPEEFDPFSPRQNLEACDTKNEKVMPQLSSADQSSNAVHDANQSVFMTPVETTPFAMRAVDVAFGGEEFVDSARLLQQGQLDLDYLEKKTTGAISQDLRKQSLYVKFDPLLEGLGNRQSLALLGRKSDIIDFTGRVTPVPEEPIEEAVVSPREPDLLCDSPSQIGGENSTFNCSQIPRGSASSRGDSVGSGSPCPRSSTVMKPDFGIIEVLKYSEEDIERILRRKKEKWAKEKEAMVHSQQELEALFQNQKILVQDFQERCERHQKATAEEKDAREREMVALKQDKKTVDAKCLVLTKANADVFQRKENLQKTLTNLQGNELKQNEQVKAFREKCSMSQKKIFDLETETADALRRICAEKNEFEANVTGQINGLQMKIMAAEFKVKSLQTALDRKKNENKELMKICDELVASQAH